MCKHWLRGLCKKGDQCEFLHEYDMSKMPECYFYARFGRFGMLLQNAISIPVVKCFGVTDLCYRYYRFSKLFHIKFNVALRSVK